MLRCHNAIILHDNADAPRTAKLNQTHNVETTRAPRTGVSGQTPSPLPAHTLSLALYDRSIMRRHMHTSARSPCSTALPTCGLRQLMFSVIAIASRSTPLRLTTPLACLSVRNYTHHARSSMCLISRRSTYQCPPRLTISLSRVAYPALTIKPLCPHSFPSVHISAAVTVNHYSSHTAIATVQCGRPRAFTFSIPWTGNHDVLAALTPLPRVDAPDEPNGA